jgi:serine/threonine protein kinase
MGESLNPLFLPWFLSKLVDFGFARHIDDKAYTFCGTPLYLPPEVILNHGYNWGADHWSLGILTYEMLTGSTPFYKQGMNQMELFRSIVRGKFEPPYTASQRGKDFVNGLLTTDPTKRLGSLADGEMDIFRHAWFSKIDFKAIRWMTQNAPYIPKVKNALHVSNFENWDHLEDKLNNNYEELTEAQKEVFELF